MTVYLAVVDRKAARGNISLENVSRTRDFLEGAASRYFPFLGSDYEKSPNITEPGKRFDVHILYWQREDTQDAVCTSQDYWAISAGHQVANKLLRSVRPRGGKLEYTSPVWGHYSTVFGMHNQSQVHAWNTVPAIEAVHWAANEDYVVITNRPLLAALYLAVVTGEEAVRLCPDFLVEYLLYSYSLSGRTPYRGVHTLSVKSSLAVVNGDVRISDVPSGLQSGLDADHSMEEAVDALHSSLVSAMDRTEDEIAGRPVQLPLSGGKDSRLLLALLRERDIDFRAVTFGNQSSVDVKLASYLNDMAGVQGEMRTPRPADGDTIVERIATTLHESDGIPASEPHTAQYRGADPERPNEAIMMGQWPLYKGGMATRMDLTPEQVNHVLKWQGGGLLAREVRAPFDTAIFAWSNRLAVSEDVEKLYLFAREFRSGRYLHAHVTQYSGRSMIAYPIADSEVGAVCDALTMNEKVSEKAIFGTLERLWPDVMRVPLDRSKWRFEAAGRDADHSGPWYDERYAPVPNSRPSKITPVARTASEYSDIAAVEMCAHIVDSNHSDFLLNFLSSGMRRAILDTAVGEVVLPKGMSDRMFKKFVWRVCVAEVWWDQAWLAI